MRKKKDSARWFLVAVMALGVTAIAHGQQGPAAPAARPSRAESSSEFDIGGSFLRTFTKASTGNGVTQTPADAYGGMLEIRYIASPLFGVEFSATYNQADETFAPSAKCGTSCNTQPANVKSNGVLAGANWVPSKQFGALRPFGLAGIGVYVDAPGSSTYATYIRERFAYTAGGGVDWAFSPHLGLRAQYREIIFSAPDIATYFPATGTYTEMGEPMGGVFCRF